MQFFKRLSVVGCLLIHLGSAAPVSADPNLLAQAQTALLTGNFPQALHMAQGPLTQSHPFDAAMIRARAALGLGQFPLALKAAQDAQAVRPNDSAARAFEGMARLGLGQTTKAMLSLRRALDLARTPQDKNIARTLIRQAKAQQKWIWNGGVGIAPSSNINKATTAESIGLVVGGDTVDAPFTGQAVSGTGLRLFGGVTRNVTIHPKAQLSFNTNLSGNFYKDSSFSNQAVQANVALNMHHSQAYQTQVKLSYHGSQFSGDPFAETRGFDITGKRALPKPGAGPRFLTYTLGYDDQLRYDAAENANTTKRARLAYTWTPTPHQQWTLGISASDRDSDSNFVAARHIGADLGLRLLPKNAPWQISLGAGVKKGDWARQASTEPDIRHDTEMSFSLSAQNNNVSFFGLTPTYGFSYLRRKSNLPRHDITSQDVFIGLANAF